MAFDKDTLDALAWLRSGWDGDNSEKAIAAFATLDNAGVFRALDEQTGYSAPCPGGGKSVSRWNDTLDRELDQPYKPGDKETCPVCKELVDVEPKSAQMRETGFQAVGILAAH